MKLYATIKAIKLQDNKHIQIEKHQGSNTQLNISLYIDDERHPRYRLHINKRKDDYTDICLVDLKKPYPNTIFEDKIKGEKQKGECDCGMCENVPT